LKLAAAAAAASLHVATSKSKLKEFNLETVCITLFSIFLPVPLRGTGIFLFIRDIEAAKARKGNEFKVFCFI